MARSAGPAMAGEPLGRMQVCGLCRETITPADDAVHLPDCVADESDPLWRFSDVRMHRACFLQWEDRKRFVQRFNRLARQLLDEDGTFPYLTAEGTQERRRAAGPLPVASWSRMRRLVILALPALLAASPARAPAQVPRPLNHVVVDGVTLYTPEALMQQRAGADAGPIVSYLKALFIAADTFFSDYRSTDPGLGLRVAVAVKPGGRSRAWSGALGDTLPTDRREALERHLETVPPPSLQGGPIAVGFNLRLNGGPAGQFTGIFLPVQWLRAAADTANHVLPDAILPAAWPDSAAAPEP